MPSTTASCVVHLRLARWGNSCLDTDIDLKLWGQANSNSKRVLRPLGFCHPPNVQSHRDTVLLERQPQLRGPTDSGARVGCPAALPTVSQGAFRGYTALGTAFLGHTLGPPGRSLSKLFILTSPHTTWKDKYTQKKEH